MTRDDAISIFQTKSSDYYGDTNKDGINPLDPAATGPATPTSNGDPSPEGGAHAQAMQAVYMTNVLVYPNNIDEDDSHDKNKKGKKIVIKKRSNNTNTIPPELEEWRCYGTTEVDLLVLRPATSDNTKENESEDETIAAVAPYTAPGMQVRDITSSTLGKERTRTIRLGILEIVYSTAMDATEQEEPEISSQHRRHGQTQHEKNGSDQKKVRGRKSRLEEEENEDTSPTLSTPARVYHSAQNIAKHMEINAKLLYESAQDQFPERTYEAGKRIYEELPLTLNRTIDVMKKVVNFFGGDGDNNDDSNNSHSGSGRPRRR
jgi:transposase